MTATICRPVMDVDFLGHEVHCAMLCRINEESPSEASRVVLQ